MTRSDSAYRFQREVDDGHRAIVGVNKYNVREPLEIPILAMDPQGETKHLARLNRVRQERDNARVRETLAALRTAAHGDDNLMYPVLDAVRAYATIGEICDVLREVFGIYQEVAIV